MPEEVFFHFGHRVGFEKAWIVLKDSLTIKMLKQGFKMTPEQLAYYQDLQNRAAMLGRTFTPDMGLSDEERELMRETMPENPLPTQNRPTIAAGRHPNSRGE